MEGDQDKKDADRRDAKNSAADAAKHLAKLPCGPGQDEWKRDMQPNINAFDGE